MSLEPFVTKIKEKMTYATGISVKVKFDLKDDGVIYIDNTGSAPDVKSGPAEDFAEDADLVITTTKPVFEGILNGTQDPNFAFMTGKLKVRGNMALAMKINAMLED